MKNKYDVEFVDYNEFDTYRMTFCLEVNSSIQKLILEKSLEKLKKKKEISKETENKIKNFQDTVIIDPKHYNLILTSIHKIVKKEYKNAKQYGYKLISHKIKEAKFSMKDNKIIILLEGEYVRC